MAVIAVAFVCLVLGNLRAQTPDEHASHHPAGAATPAAGAMPATPSSSPSIGGGMMAGMGDMMKGMMGGSPPKELYPTLMTMPELSPEQRKQIEEQASERMRSGSMLIGQALDSLNTGVTSSDNPAMQEALTRLHEGGAQMASGVAARQAITESRAPREIALAWFKREMTLPSGGIPVSYGITPFHLFTMLLLVTFFVAMLAMYFFKMRRAAALFGRIEAGKGTLPPGAAPELSGGKPPEKKPPSRDPPSPDPPPDGKKPSPENSPPPGNLTPATLASANWRGQLQVGSIIVETPNVKTFRLLPLPGDSFLPFTFIPGQFLNLAFWIGGARMNRSYSISSSPNQREHVDLTVRREPRGAVSRHIDDLLKVGDKIEVGGPVGKFTFTGKEAASIVLISGGVGITPMVSISRYLSEQSWPGDIYFIYVCRTPEDYIFASEIAALERSNSKLHVVVTMTRPEGTDWKGPTGHLTAELLTKTVPDLTSKRIHLCGPIPMMDATKAILAEVGVPPEQLKTEAFGTPKPIPAEGGTTAKPSGPAAGPLITFSKNTKSAKCRLDLQNGDSPPEQTILELSEELGIGIEFSCRVGTCGVCKVKKTDGEVDQAVQDALDDDDKKNGIILACQAKPKSDVTVEA